LGVLVSLYMNSVKTEASIYIPNPVTSDFDHGMVVDVTDLDHFTYNLTKEEREKLLPAQTNLLIKRCKKLNNIEIAGKVAELYESSTIPD
jgi:hypothetical protein